MTSYEYLQTGPNWGCRSRNINSPICHVVGKRRVSWKLHFAHVPMDLSKSKKGSAPRPKREVGTERVSSFAVANLKEERK